MLAIKSQHMTALTLLHKYGANLHVNNEGSRLPAWQFILEFGTSTDTQRDMLKFLIVNNLVVNNNDGMCSVCWDTDDKPNVLFFPCRHVTVCKQCFEVGQFSTFVKCRAPVKFWVDFDEQTEMKQIASKLCDSLE